MRWIYGLFAVTVLLMVVGVGLAEVFPPLFLLGPAFWLVMGFSVRCPVCRKHMMENDRGYVAPWIETPKTCVGCGRRKDDIWPFQWLIRPEHTRAKD